MGHCSGKATMIFALPMTPISIMIRMPILGIVIRMLSTFLGRLTPRLGFQGLNILWLRIIKFGGLSSND